ncbi:MAG TPA: hypothetical protein VLK89_06700 [Solirubrobacterales bacterium]|nr:hypothetical protein [Solirubrobacterales bacterium]
MSVVVVRLEAAERGYLVGDDRAGGVGVAEGYVAGGSGSAGEDREAASIASAMTAARRNRRGLDWIDWFISISSR